MSQQTYFKNPYRGRKAAKPKPYQPEHERLEMDAVEYPLKDPEEFEKMNRKIAAEKKKSDKKKKIDDQAKCAIDRFRNGEWSKEQLEEALRDLYSEVPKQEIAAKPTTPFVSSGQSDDLQWTKALNDGGRIVVDDQIDDVEIEDDDIPDPPDSPFVEDEEVDPKTGKVIPPLTEEDVAKMTSDLIADVREAAEEVKEELSVEEDDGFGLDQVKLGEYVLLYKNSVLGMGSLESVKNTLTSIMDGDEKLSVEDFVVMKRVPVKMGIFIDD